MLFFVGLHNPAHARRFARCMVSANTLRGRKADFEVDDWMLDSGAFTQVTKYGGFLDGPEVYAEQIVRWSRCGNLLAAVSQDYMCEAFVLEKTGLTVGDHQRMTVERYAQLRELVPESIHVLPVLQGYWPDEYLRCLELYGPLVRPGMWVGVGSVCKRNSDVEGIEQVLVTLHRARPDLKLHGFGVKTTALESSLVRESLYSADSMAWSDAARNQAKPLLMALRRAEGRHVMPREARAYYRERGVHMPNANDWREAQKFVERIEGQEVRERSFQGRLFH